MLDAQKLTEIQLDSLVIYHYISLFDRFEKLVKACFSASALHIDDIARSKLYFYFGSTVGNKVYIDYENRSVKMNNRVFNDSELFKDLTLNQIIKIDKKENLIDIFKFNISSLMQRKLEYPFHDCCIKLIKMRNKLAHELEDIRFNDAELIEMFTKEYIAVNTKEWLKGNDIRLMKDSTISIYSNFIIMENIYSMLEEKQG